MSERLVFDTVTKKYSLLYCIDLKMNKESNAIYETTKAEIIDKVKAVKDTLRLAREPGYKNKGKGGGKKPARNEMSDDTIKQIAKISSKVKKGVAECEDLMNQITTTIFDITTMLKEAEDPPEEREHYLHHY